MAADGEDEDEVPDTGASDWKAEPVGIDDFHEKTEV